ncbi:MAG: hypothetical protein JO006_02150 [Paucibacter sp.]|nr:hypothetical protein [Roseateles sp.]
MAKLFAPVVLIAAALVAGCGAPSQSMTMTVDKAELLQLRTWVPDALKFNVMLEHVQGGENTSFWWGSAVSAMAFENALDDSLRGVGMVPPAPPAGKNAPRFLLKAHIIALMQPLVAAAPEVGISVRYQLVDQIDGKLVYERTLRTTGRAAFTDAMLSQPERLRLANEDAVRNNLVTALKDLMALRLQ